ncbi:hypothetical protein PPO43_02150 [Saprospira sp. CCB-QB6]|uniref:hypothetical protein n=1 Tax=Saprospira sp. CCB-QB6 TaxID=3023936 RepID=UPI00234B8F7F|nr:hypothetical protein [Saprospira sp. CCB-QB6]WCL81900.1 hypothetical protein PPO43_02150 [Saprospira sp. CCB-QB6]
MRLLLILLCLPFLLLAQEQPFQQRFSGQISGVQAWSPQQGTAHFSGLRYLPNYFASRSWDSSQQAISFDVALNVSASASYLGGAFETNLRPYRFWLRYTRPRLELRLGLQKIDFGSAQLLRPLQWFHQIDPRDPLALTNGVYAFLGRYYFKQNANIWFWALYGNQQRRGFDLLSTQANLPELGGRFQYPLPKGELALSYHYRWVKSDSSLAYLPNMGALPEHRWSLDGKWDLGIGLWLEAVQVYRMKALGPYRAVQQLNLGLDYTFAWGNGLNCSAEYLFLGYGISLFQRPLAGHTFAFQASYPLSLYDQLSLIYISGFQGKRGGQLSYSHQFKHLSLYLIGGYNPRVGTINVQQNDLSQQFLGWNLRLVLAYNY